MKLIDIKYTAKRKIISILGIKIRLKRGANSAITQQELINILNNAVDITNAPKAKGKLRKLQIADTILLHIVHKVCQKHKIPYYISWGTLLGAIRHEDFIPWDDDVDINVLEEDYNSLVKALRKEFAGTKLKVYGDDETCRGAILSRVAYSDLNIVNVDIFKTYYSKIDYTQKELYKKLCHKVVKSLKNKYRNAIKFNTAENIKNYKLLSETMYKEVINACIEQNAKTIFNGVGSEFSVLKKEWVYPLKTARIGQYEFLCPNNPMEVLKEYYGNYMSFPLDFNPHGETFYQFNDKQIDDAIEYLKNIEQKI